ncbi:PRC and DUF2382 domain-containing protein [Streptomyces sp. NPDC051662]|uniref:PRC and DUF2382 domain-containing protein n=1 Tax=Streptomyces sp. NPDC051662 TaxID=3154750 RepID=UPI00342E454E
MSADGVFDNPSRLNGLAIYDKDGDKIGNVGQVYVGDRSGRPEWVTVKTGLFGMKESLVPLSGARRAGEDIHVPYAKETVKDAPRLDADEHLDPSQEKQLYKHYGLTATGAGLGMASDTAAGTGTASGTRTTAGTTAGAPSGTGRTGAGRATGGLAGAATTGGAGRPMAGVRGSTPDEGKERHGEELIRSEEQLYVSTEEHEVGHARLRKVVVTENVTTSVPLSHEEVRVIHEAISPEDRTGVRGSLIGEAQTEVTLHAEEPVIRKESVPVERVRMETEKVTEQKEVSAEVRKEQIEYDTDQTDTGMGGRRGSGR